MISEFELYHGVVLRAIVSQAASGVYIEPFDFGGRLDSFKVGANSVIHIKYSSKRLSPWSFTLTKPNLLELIEIRRRIKNVHLVFVCGRDGFVGLTLQEFIEISKSKRGGAVSIRISRNRNEMYAVSGNAAKLSSKKASGLNFALLNANI